MALASPVMGSAGFVGRLKVHLQLQQSGGLSSAAGLEYFCTTHGCTFLAVLFCQRTGIASRCGAALSALVPAIRPASLSASLHALPAGRQAGCALLLCLPPYVLCLAKCCASFLAAMMRAAGCDVTTELQAKAAPLDHTYV